MSARVDPNVCPTNTSGYTGAMAAQLEAACPGEGRGSDGPAV